MRAGITIGAVFAIAIMAAALPLSREAGAVPANPAITEVTQPNGMKFRILNRGDEFQAWQQTTDGYTVVKNPATGFYEFARQGANGNLVPSGIIVTPSREAGPAAPGR